jgi:hypothetical protein
MALKDQIPAILQYIKDNGAFTDHNATALDIYEGNLKPYVLDIMQRTLSDNYFQKIKHRALPINILRKVVDKLSKVYLNDPIRTDANYQQFIDDYSYWLRLNERMNVADEYANLFKGYALEPFVHNGQPKLRVIPYDRFLVMSEDSVDPMTPTMFIKFMGEVQKMDGRGKRKANKYHAYTAEEFISFDSDGDIIYEDMEGNDGVNPIGRVPFVYGNRSRINLIPQPDTDVIQLTKIIPVMLTDLSGAVLFQCFSIIYGVDIDSANLVMSPNAYWDLKSDPKSDKTPQVGTIKPEADIERVLQFIASTLAFWLETKGVRVGSIGNLSVDSAASGIAKIIDEMDSFEIRKQNIKFFKNEEYELWSLLKDMNNYWVRSNQIQYGLIGDDFDPTIEFDEPKPMISRADELNMVIIELNNGLITKEKAIKRLYPDATPEEIKELLDDDIEEAVIVTNQDMTEDEDDSLEGQTSSSEEGA